MGGGFCMKCMVRLVRGTNGWYCPDCGREESYDDGEIEEPANPYIV